MENRSAVPLLDTPGRGVVLICDQMATRSPLIGGDPPDSDERKFYIALFSGILARSERNILFHASRRDRDQSVTAAAIERWRRQLPPARQARFRVIDTAPLDSLLGDIDLFVSFASPALVEACRRGLKPVQIGRVLTGSAGFTHFFGDSAAFIDRVARGGFCGRLTLDEYSEFESFGDALRADPAAGSALARDPIVGEFCRANRPRLSPRQVIADILANPVGALRLLVGTLAGLFGRKAGG